MNQPRTPLDQARLRPHLRTGNVNTTEGARVRWVNSDPIPTSNPVYSWQHPNPGDLRGIPIIGRGVQGATHHTKPGANL